MAAESTEIRMGHPKVKPTACREAPTSPELETSASDVSLASTIRRWEQPALRFAYRITGDLAEAEDIRQTVFLQMLERPPAFWRDENRLRAWMYRCVSNAAISSIRKRQRRSKSLDLLKGVHAGLQADDPAETVARSEEKYRLGAAMMELSPRERELLALRFDEDLSFSEIAAVVRRPLSTVKAQTNKAIDRLRQILATQEPSN